MEGEKIYEYDLDVTDVATLNATDPTMADLLGRVEIVTPRAFWQPF